MITPLFPGAALLVPHPDSAPAPLSLIQVTVGRGPEGALVLDYRLQGDLAALRLPSAAAPAPADRLWAHTCCEVFLARDGAAAYREYNFSPSGQWAGYGFAAYRQRDALALPPPGCDWQRREGVLALSVTLPMAALPSGDGALRLALTAVLEGRDGALSYWALAHPAGHPDFHHRDGFVLALPDL